MLYESNVEDIADYVVPKSDTPHVIMVVGVNGVGKTTTIGKLAHQFKNKGQRGTRCSRYLQGSRG